MELQKAKQIAIELIEEHCPEYTFAWSNGKVIFGNCDYHKKKISISKTLTLLNSENVVIDTIKHEIAHALNKGYGHNNKWRLTCIQLGCNPSRCYSGNEVINPKGKYIFVCPNCDNRVEYYRKNKYDLSCGKCCNKYNNGKYSEKFKLELLA